MMSIEFDTIMNKSINSSIRKSKMRRIPMYFSIFNEIILDIIDRRKLTFELFSELLFETLDRLQLYYPDRFDYRNQMTSKILGNRKLTYNQFKFIIEEVFNEQIPDDPEITHLMRLYSKGKDLRGEKIGRLTVVECLGIINNDKHIYWRCICDCGTEVSVRSSDLIAGSSRSCGCLKKEMCRDIGIKYSTTHGMRGTSEYNSWASMIQRCCNINQAGYNRYGGRGIVVCERWRHSFENFYEDMGPRPEGMSIERIDNDGNYEPSNCKWATNIEQMNNTMKTLRFDDDTPVGLWARENCLDYQSVVRYYKKGYSQIDILKKLTS